jgi:hypothetical protein
MALKPDRIEQLTDISFHMNVVAERGGVVSYVPGSTGVGASMDDSNAVVEYAADAFDARPAGVLLNDVVNIDQTRQHLNWHKDEVQVGSKVTLLRIGQVTTDQIDGDPVAGDPAYVGPNGTISTTGGANIVQIGTFLSGKDSDAYAKVSINLQ